VGSSRREEVDIVGRDMCAIPVMFAESMTGMQIQSRFVERPGLRILSTTNDPGRVGLGPQFLLLKSNDRE